MRSALRAGLATVVGGGVAAIAGRQLQSQPASSRASDEDAIAQLQRQADKARRRAQERVKLAEGTHMLGMTPKLWLEALDEEHRYGSLLYHYWQRWEASSTRWMFFDWLDHGRGALIDLPSCPRRMLEEGKTIYLTREQLKLCEVQIDRGRLIWVADGQPVTLPLPEGVAETPRARAIADLIEVRLYTTRNRERLLRDARAVVTDAMRQGLPATPEALEAVTTPLIQDGLLRPLRDPYFHDRPAPMPTIQDETSYQLMWEQFKRRSRWTSSGERIDPKTVGPAYALPTELLPGVGWTDVLAALDHEEGHGMKHGPLPTADERLRPKPGKGGIFAIDQYGIMHAGPKVSGAFHHSSFTGGHCCRFAGSITVDKGRVLKLTPHSGHYVPTEAEYTALINAWREAGLDLSSAEITGLVKEKRKPRG